MFPRIWQQENLAADVARGKFSGGLKIRVAKGPLQNLRGRDKKRAVRGREGP